MASPWTTESAAWLQIDQSLADDHPARTAAAIVALLDLEPLERTYAGVGSPPVPPARLLALVLYELDRGELSPAQWAVDGRERDPAKWLLLGLTPAASTLYAFRERIGPSLDEFNRQILQRAIAAGLTTAEHAAADGTFVAAFGSRHRLVNATVLTRRLEQLETAMAVDVRAKSAADPAPAPPADPAPVPPADPVPVPPAAAPAAPAGPPEAWDMTPPAPPPAAGPAAIAPPSGSSPPPRPATAAAPPPGPPHPAWMAKTPAGRRRQHRRHRRAADELQRRLDRHRQTRSKRSKARRRSDDRVRICPSEPEAVLGRDKLKVFRPLYNVQLARDLESPLILAYDVLPQANDSGCFGPLLDRADHLCGRKWTEAVVDSSYASLVDLKVARQRDVTVYAPVKTAAAQAEGREPAAPPEGPVAARQADRRQSAVLPKE